MEWKVPFGTGEFLLALVEGRLESLSSKPIRTKGEADYLRGWLLWFCTHQLLGSSMYDLTQTWASSSNSPLTSECLQSTRW